MAEVQQLLIAAEALVIFTKRQLERIDREWNRCIQAQGTEVNWKTKDRFSNVLDDYLTLYHELFMTIDDLKIRYEPEGVEAFVKRHLQPVLDLIADKVEAAEKRYQCWKELTLNPDAYKTIDFVKRCGEMIKN